MLFAYQTSSQIDGRQKVKICAIPDTGAEATVFGINRVEEIGILVKML